MKRLALSWWLGACLGAGLCGAVMTPPPVIAAEPPRATGPRVSDIRIETRENHQKGRLYQVDDYMTVISARIEPGSGGTIRAENVSVLLRGRLLTVGKRTYDIKSGRFMVMLTTKDIMAAMADGVPEGSAPAVTVVARDASGREGRASYTAPATTLSIDVHVEVTTIDPFGRSVPVDREATPPTAPVGMPLSITPGTLDPGSPLQLRVLKRVTVSPSETPTDHPDGRLVAGASGLDVSYQGAYTSLLAAWDPVTGKLGTAVPVFATPSGNVRRARRENGQVYSLAWGAGARTFLEATGTGRRITVPMDLKHTIQPELPVDFVADDRRWVVLSSEGQMLGGGWDGHATWRVSSDRLFPMYIGPHDPDPVLARQADGTLTAFFVGEDDREDEDLSCVGLAHVSADGRVLAARLITLPSQGESDMGLSGGGGTLYRGRRLLVANRLRYDRQHGTESHETLVYDVDSRRSTPILTLTDGEAGTLPVYGAVVLGDRLYLGCGPGGIAVIDAP